MTETRAIQVTGIVEGVGFRPFVYNLARDFHLDGWVNNSSDGVHVLARGTTRSLDSFLEELPLKAPKMSRIDSVTFETVKDDPSLVDAGFVIAKSTYDPCAVTLVSPDIATCPDCLAELFDEDDRRYHYPYINCTQCGPRFTIIDGLPYDRPATSMASFAMCPSCDEEYHDPANRRFHAQPDACFDCGPHLFWHERTEDGDVVREDACDRASSDALIARAAGLIGQGGILALKGLGGYHLACDACDEEAVARLRERKHRPDKPFAIMLPALEDVRGLCEVGPEEEELLCGSVRPIVLLRRRRDTEGILAHGVAFGLAEIGVMLPYTPLQHLLLRKTARPLVMTSGNITEEPILADDEEAARRLEPVADALLGGNRAILSRYDDSVMRVVDGVPTTVRRARGIAPAPLSLPSQLRDAPRLLACGPEQKSTFTLTRDGRAFVSQHLGDLEDSEAYQAWTEALSLYGRLFHIEPALIACDAHPAYLSTQWATAESARRGLPLHHIQHHHAHIASVTGEHGIDSPVVGVALDGTGLGTDGTVWGGEVLVCDWIGFRRAAHLRTFPLPGGKAAVHNPCRAALGLLSAFGLDGHPGARRMVERMDAGEVEIVSRLVDRRLNSPLTSSAGRLFDAASALCGCTLRASYDGQAAMEFEAACADDGTSTYANGETDAHEYDRAARRVHDETDAYEYYGETGCVGMAEDSEAIDTAPLVEEMLDLLEGRVDVAEVSRRFHEGLARVIVGRTVGVAHDEGIGTVALSGGVFMNRRMLCSIRRGLEDAGLEVICNDELPANDGCISFGQAVIASARALRGEDDTEGMI